MQKPFFLSQPVLLVFLVLAIGFAGCNQSAGPNLEEKIVGQWELNSKDYARLKMAKARNDQEKAGAQMITQLKWTKKYYFLADGTGKSGLMVGNFKPNEWSYELENIKDQTADLIITQDGKSRTWKITLIDDRQLKMESDDPATGIAESFVLDRLEENDSK